LNSRNELDEEHVYVSVNLWICV